MASASRLDPFDPATFDVYRSALVAPSVRLQSARDLVTEELLHSSSSSSSPSPAPPIVVTDGPDLQQALWWERAVYERATRAFERNVLLKRVRCDPSAYMTVMASRMPDLYYPHELRVLKNQVRARGSWGALLELCDGVISNYSNLTIEQLSSGMHANEDLEKQERIAAAQSEKLSSSVSFAPSRSEFSVRCRRCKGDNVTVVLRQLRSADEPMTQCFTCLNPACGAQWRMG